MLAAAPAHAKYASIVIEADSGRVLHSTNADTRNYPASLTKIMTLYMLFDALDTGKVTLKTRMRVSRRASGMAPSKLGLKRGRTINVKTAINALITKSANDVAVVVAEHLSGSESAFARAMTRRARQIGMRRTTFRNASGLPNRGQLSTARDMSILAQRIHDDFPRYFGYFSTQRFSYGKRTYRNHNRLLRTYSGTDGIKTGYTRASGFNLVASVERKGKRLIGVVFGGRTARSRDRHMRTLLDKAFRKAGPAPAIAQAKDRRAKAKPIRLSRKKQTRPRALPKPIRQPVVIAAATTGPTTIAQPGTPVLGPQQWAIQVGAFGRPDAARQAARRASKRLDMIGRSARLVIAPFDTNGKRVYRAQLAGISEAKARQACRQLKTFKVACVAMSPKALGARVAFNQN